MKAASEWGNFKYHAFGCWCAIRYGLGDVWDRWVKRNIVADDSDEPAVVAFDPTTRWFGMGATDASTVEDFLWQIEPTMRNLK